jgi:hypothetical protein
LQRAEVIAEEHDSADWKRRCRAEFNAGVVPPEAIATGEESLPGQSAGKPGSIAPDVSYREVLSLPEV